MVFSPLCKPHDVVVVALPYQQVLKNPPDNPSMRAPFRAVPEQIKYKHETTYQ